MKTINTQVRAVKAVAVMMWAVTATIYTNLAEASPTVPVLSFDRPVLANITWDNLNDIINEVKEYKPAIVLDNGGRFDFDYERKDQKKTIEYSFNY